MISPEAAGLLQKKNSRSRGIDQSLNELSLSMSKIITKKINCIQYQAKCNIGGRDFSAKAINSNWAQNKLQLNIASWLYDEFFSKIINTLNGIDLNDAFQVENAKIGGYTYFQNDDEE